VTRDISAGASNKRKSESRNTHNQKKPKTQEASNAELEGDKELDTRQRPRARIIVPRRSPLPARTARKLHPGDPDKPRPRRSSEDVSVASARKEELKAQLARAEKEKIDLLAEMALEDDMEADAEEATAIRSLEDLADASPGGDQTDSSDPVPIHSPDDSEDETSGETGKTDDASDPKNHVSSKKARKCKSTIYDKLTAIHSERQVAESELKSRQRRGSSLAFVGGKLTRALLSKSIGDVNIVPTLICTER
jgi:hypothetical protein